MTAISKPSLGDYSMPVNVDLVLGEPKDFIIRQWIMRTIDPLGISTNAPCPNFVRLDSMTVDGVLLPPFYNGEGDTADRCYTKYDAFAFNGGVPFAYRAALCDHGAELSGHYAGFIPEEWLKQGNWKAGDKFLFCVCIHGNARVPLTADGLLVPYTAGPRSR
jgi:hypothetical protein